VIHTVWYRHTVCVCCWQCSKRL